MPQITIRGIAPEIGKEIRRIAKESRKSVNQIIKEIIHKEFERHNSPASSLKQLAGGWSRKEAKTSIDFFKSEAKKHHTQYQKMIRRLLDEYAAHHS